MEREKFYLMIDSYIGDKKIKSIIQRKFNQMGNNDFILIDGFSQKLLLNFLKEEYPENAELIENYLKNDIERYIEYKECGIFKIRNHNDFYDYLTYLINPTEKIVDLITEKILQGNVRELPNDKEELKQMIIEEPELIIEIIKNSENDVEDNVIVELKIFIKNRG